MKYLKEQLFSDIEGKNINICITTENSELIYLFKNVYISLDEELFSGNEELKINWDKAEIEKENDLYIIKLPEITYKIYEVVDEYY